jgi:hypothetical protein
MNKVIVDDELRAKLDLSANVTELCDADGKPVAYVMRADEYWHLGYAWVHAEASTPQAESEIKAAEEAYARGDYVTSEQLFAEIDTLLRRRAAS